MALKNKHVRDVQGCSSLTVSPQSGVHYGEASNWLLIGCSWFYRVPGHGTSVLAGRHGSVLTSKMVSFFFVLFSPVDLRKGDNLSSVHLPACPTGFWASKNYGIHPEECSIWL